MKKSLFVLGIAVLAGSALIGCQGHSHEFSEATFVAEDPASCTETGVEAHYLCSCGKLFDVNHNETTQEQLVINALGHSYESSQWTTDTNPTCTTDGSKHRDCDRCGQSGRQTESVAHLGHNMVKVNRQEPTCTAMGFQDYYKCSRSGCSYCSTDAAGSQEIADIAAWKQDTTRGGIAATGQHVYEEVATAANLKTPADCENAAVYFKSCQCGLKSTDTFEYGDPEGHDYGTLVPKDIKTCDKDGFDAHYQCSKCQKYFTSEKVETTEQALVIQKGHEISADAKADPTFAEDGHVAGYTCALCKTHYSDAEGTAVIEESAWKVAKLTATEDATKLVYYDLDAGAFDEVETSLSGYSYVNADLTAVSATGRELGEAFDCYAMKDGQPSYKIKGMVVSKVIKTAAEWKTIFAPQSDEDGIIEGYWVLGNDITGLSRTEGWDTKGNSASGKISNDLKIIGTIDGRNHKVVSPSISGIGGLWGGAGHVETLKVRNLEFENCVIGGYGAFGYWPMGFDWENVKISAAKNSSKDNLMGQDVVGGKFVNCTFDVSERPNMFVLGPTFKLGTFENCTVIRACSNKLGTTLKGVGAWTETYAEEGLTWQFNPNKYKQVEAVEATYLEGGHIAGYECLSCGKHFSDAAHTTEIADADYYNSEALPSTLAEGKQLFYNLATSSLDVSEVSGLDASTLVNGYGKTPSFVEMAAGDKGFLYKAGSPATKYEVVVVTNVISSEADFINKLYIKNDATADLTGYYVITKDLDVVNTGTGGTNSNKNAVKLTLDGRGHTLNELNIKNATGGIFGSESSNNDVKMLNMKIKKYTQTSYGCAGWGPAGKLYWENIDIVAMGPSIRYGVVAVQSSGYHSFKNCVFDFSQMTDYAKKDDSDVTTEVYNGSYLYKQGTNYPKFEGCTMIIKLSHDTTRLTYSVGNDSLTNGVRPDAIIGAKTVSTAETPVNPERTGLDSLITGMTFLTARP